MSDSRKVTPTQHDGNILFTSAMATHEKPERKPFS
jgi:hypothetical protein